MKLTRQFLECQTVKDLKSFIRLSGYSGYSKLKKKQLINFILKNIVIDGMDTPSQPGSIAEPADEEYSDHNLKNVKLTGEEIVLLLRKIKEIYDIWEKRRVHLDRSFSKDADKWMKILENTRYNEDYEGSYWDKSKIYDYELKDIPYYQAEARLDEIFKYDDTDAVLYNKKLY
jgi:hypothetical protein